MKARKEKSLLSSKNHSQVEEDIEEVRCNVPLTSLFIDLRSLLARRDSTTLAYGTLFTCYPLHYLLTLSQNVTLALVSDATVVPVGNLAAPIQERMIISLATSTLHLLLWLDVWLTEHRDATGKHGFYKPIIFPNEFWHLRQHYIQINETTPSLPLQITFQPMSWMKFQLFASMTHGFNEAQKQQGQGSSAEFDELKRMLLETNPWFLGLTGLVSILHVV